MSSHFYWPVRVYIEDTDAGGIVYYVNYLKYMERARTECLRSLGFDKPALPEEGKLLIVVSVNVNYLRSAQLDNELFVSANIIKLAKSYCVFEQTISAAKTGESDQVYCRGEVKIACVDMQSRKPVAMPDAMYQAMKKILK